MAKNFTIDWKGDEVMSTVERATKDGIDIIMGECLPTAKDDVPVATSAYHGSIKVVEKARKVGGEIAGIWGSTDINYALAIETGDRSYLRGSGLTEKGEKRVPTHRNKGNHGSLRKAADRHYKDLAKTIASMVKG